MDMIAIEAIRNLSEGDTFGSKAAVLEVTQKMGKNAKPYWEMRLMDATGILDAKIWSNGKWHILREGAGEDAENRWKEQDPLENDFGSRCKGKALGIMGRVQSYKGQNQYTLSSLFLLDEKEYPLSQFVPSSPVPLQDLESRFRSLLDSCGEPIKGFLEHVFSGDRWERFRDWPAAVSHHHAYVHGLLEHTLGVTQNAVALAETYAALGVSLERDAVLAGALLHDLGKLQAYTLTPLPEMTVAGNVHDHIALGFAELQRLAEEYGLEERVALHLGHILLSHHGKKEFGSPVMPSTVEALIVAAADNLDFQIFCGLDAVESMADHEEITEWNRVLERRFWKWK
ncbi:MAG TPA: HD domain-containing protein [Synergistaceae bacterium]|nr:HD domain-containing protein [Synergistaceae bacterium]HPJ26409.1 HD domain-containing protein [Synergistaceae bacterium]HPQ37882.1 HD domain-containing protein [Synergistaceae bacterium]